MSQISLAVSSSNLLTLLVVLFVAGFGWCAGCWTWGLIASGFAALRGGRWNPPRAPDAKA